MRVLLFLIYGEQRVYHLELTYSILSAWQFLKEDPADIRIVLASDARNQRPDLPVEPLLLSREMLTQWSMDGTYFHAMKLHVVRHALQHFNVPVAFIDTDTVFKAHPKHLFERIQTSQALMHACEGPLDQSAEWHEWEGVITACGGQITGRPLSPHTVMHNAGVYGLMPEHAPFMETAIAILHELRQHGSVFTAEQLASSMALGEALDLAECRDLMEHYWHGPRAYFHYQMGQMFPAVRRGDGIPDVNMSLPLLQRQMHGKVAHKIAARLKRIQRGQSAEFEFAYRGYLSAIAHRHTDTELANVWALTALNTLTWGMDAAPPARADLQRDFARFAPPQLEAQDWLTPELRARWQAYWSAASRP